MTREIKFGKKVVGDGYPAYIIAEIGINHNGDLDIARRMIEAAVHSGADAVKFQKRTPQVSTPLEQQKQMRETPWGYITYLDYRYKVELGLDAYQEIDRTCKKLGIDWLVSVWDEPSVDFMEQFETPAYKIPSASLTDRALLKYTRTTGKPMANPPACHEYDPLFSAFRFVHPPCAFVTSVFSVTPFVNTWIQ